MFRRFALLVNFCTEAVLALFRVCSSVPCSFSFRSGTFMVCSDFVPRDENKPRTNADSVFKCNFP